MDLSFDENDIIVYSPVGSEELEEEVIVSSENIVTEENVHQTLSTAFEDISDDDNEVQIPVPTVPQNTSSMYQCQFCPVVAHSVEEFIKHFILHFGNRLKYREEEEFGNSNSNNVRDKFVCSICGGCFDNKDLVRDHTIRDHGYKESKTKKSVPSTSRRTVDNFVNPGRGNHGKTLEFNGNSSDDEEKSKNFKDKKGNLTNDEKEEYLKPMTLKKLKQKLFLKLIEKCTMPRCSFKFETAEKRELHLKCHVQNSSTDNKKYTFKCFECMTEFQKWRECDLHLWKAHKIDVQMMTCPICQVKFDISVKLHRHLQIHQSVKAFGCSYCTKSFATQQQLYVHERLHTKQMKKAGMDDDEKDGQTEEPEKLRWYSERKCDTCGHIFSTSKILSKHIKTVHHKIKPYNCSVCPYKSARKVTLNIHMRQHTGQKPLACKVCDFRTADPSALKNHEKRHTKDTNYKCKFCNFVAIQSTQLKAHMKGKHPREFEMLKCDMCNFTSVNPDLLMRHKQDHRSGLIKSEDSRDSIISRRSKNGPESSSDCFLQHESTDSVVHDAGGFTIPAVYLLSSTNESTMINLPVVAHNEDTQFPI